MRRVLDVGNKKWEVFFSDIQLQEYFKDTHTHFPHVWTIMSIFTKIKRDENDC